MQFISAAAAWISARAVTHGCFLVSDVLPAANRHMKTDDLRIVKTHPLLSPAILAEEIPLTDIASTKVCEARRAIEAILDGKDARLLVVVGPCSIHDTKAALEYATKLKPIADALADALLIVMRVYFEKPRTVVGWKGLINDPDLDESYHINKGLRLARQLLADILELGVPAGHRVSRYDLRPVLCRSDQLGRHRRPHRGEPNSPRAGVGFVDAGRHQEPHRRQRPGGRGRDPGRASRHLFPSLTKEGAPAILETTGNPYAHLVLRGGSETGPNFDAAAIESAVRLLRAAHLPEVLMVDCSHGNSDKDATRQIDVAEAIMKNLKGSPVRALMIESHLVAGPSERTRDLRSKHHRCLPRVRGNESLALPARRRRLGRELFERHAEQLQTEHGVPANLKFPLDIEN